MPHIIVEYTETLSVDVPRLLDELHESLAGQDTIDIHAIKTRAIPVKFSLVGDMHEANKFIHITLKLLSGRTEDLRRTMAEALQKVALSHTHNDNITLSVDVVEMDPATYMK